MLDKLWRKIGLDVILENQQLYRAMDELLEVQSDLEHQVYCDVSDLLNLEVDLLLL